MTKESQHTPEAVQPQTMPQETVPLQSATVREIETINKTAETRMVAPNAAPLEENIVVHSPQITRQDAVLKSDERLIETTQIVEEGAISHVVERASVAESVVEARSVETPIPFETASVQTEQKIESSTAPSDLNNDHTQADTTHVQVGSSAVQPSVEEKNTALSDQHASLKTGPLQSNPGTRADYGWLREALWSRIERLKGYPYIARTNRWEGLVILEAIINSDGNLVDLRIVESSGHLALDRDAMEVMRKSCPIHLKHSLGKPEVKLQIPISYKLR
jgi:protein TonB